MSSGTVPPSVMGASEGSLGKVAVEGKATEVVLDFLRDTRVGRIVPRKGAPGGGVR